MLPHTCFTHSRHQHMLVWLKVLFIPDLRVLTTLWIDKLVPLCQLELVDGVLAEHSSLKCAFIRPPPAVLPGCL